MPERPFAYVCSPFRGDMDKNTRFAREYSRKAFEAGYCPLAPHLLFPQFLDDTDPAQRQAALEMGLALLAQCRQLVVCGGTVTEGMELEVNEARRLGIPIYPLADLPRAQQPERAGKQSLLGQLDRPPATPGEHQNPAPEQEI